MTPLVLNFLRHCPSVSDVLEIGSYNVNGSARDVIRHQTWTGLDMRPGPGVDVVADATDLSRYADGSFDCVVCCETLEHVKDWQRVVSEAWRVLAMDGVMVITTPAPGFPYHEYPEDHWRFTSGDWSILFLNQQIIAIDQWRSGSPASGIIVQKVNTDPLPFGAVQPQQTVPPTTGDMHVAIATPFYERKGFSPYITSLVNLLGVFGSVGIKASFLELPGDPYLDRGKNTLMKRFLDSEATDLLMIDSDMGWAAVDLLRYFIHPREMIGTAYLKKSESSDEAWAASIYTDVNGFPDVDSETGLIRAAWVPGGLTRYNRTCVARMYAAYKSELGYVDPSADILRPDDEFVSLFECVYMPAMVNGRPTRVRATEDVVFCQRFREIGGEVWLEPRVSTSHYGSRGWHGNYHEYLLSLAAPAAPETPDLSSAA